MAWGTSIFCFDLAFDFLRFSDFFLRMAGGSSTLSLAPSAWRFASHRIQKRTPMEDAIYDSLPSALISRNGPSQDPRSA